MRSRSLAFLRANPAAEGGSTAAELAVSHNASARSVQSSARAKSRNACSQTFAFITQQRGLSGNARAARMASSRLPDRRRIRNRKMPASSAPR